MPYQSPNSQDAALDYIKSNADRAIYTNGEPSDYAEADTPHDSGNSTTTFKVAERPVVLSSFVGPEDFTDSNGSGRKIVLKKGGWLGLDDAEVGFIALVDDDGEELLAVSDAATPVSVQEGFAYNNLEADFKQYDAEVV